MQGASGCWAVVFSQELGGAGLFIPDSNLNLGLIISCSLRFHFPHFLSLWLRNAAAWGPPKANIPLTVPP